MKMMPEIARIEMEVKAGVLEITQFVTYSPRTISIPLELLGVFRDTITAAVEDACPLEKVSE